MKEKLVMTFPTTRKMVAFIKDHHIIIHEYDLFSRTLSVPWNEKLAGAVASYGGAIVADPENSDVAGSNQNGQ